MRRRILSALFLVFLLAALPAPAADAHGSAQPTLANPGFEQDGTGVASPTGWRSFGSTNADFTEAGGHAGSLRLSHWSTSPFAVATTQRVEHLRGGWYTLRAWVRRSAGDNDSSIGLDGEGCAERSGARTQVPVSSSQWLQVTTSVYVRKGSCTIVLRTRAAAGEWTNFDDVELVQGAAMLSIRGADVSSLTKSEDKGGVYRTASGRRDDALEILRENGLNWIRLRAWVNPADGYHDKAELLAMAQRAKAQRLQVLVDLHYSDTWADPGKQGKPAAWASLAFPDLLVTFRAYTADICNSLKAQGTPPAMIQLGNELNSGMLWPDGHTWDPPNWDNLAQLLTAGYQAVKSCSPSTRVMLHLANGGDNGLYRWWFDNITSRGVPFDVIGASFYEYWHGPLGDLQNNLNDISARYNKDVVVAETAYPFTLADDDNYENIINDPSELVAGYPATPEGQASNLRDVMSIVRAVPNGRGLGVFYWDATWTGVPGNGWDPADPTTGNAWENQALFGFDARPVPAMRAFRP
jgi:arabinogalactan endo-1,4-beta-galactosidase